MKHDGPWRVPDEESTDLYPGLVVHDGRVTGSITFGPTRLPLWAPQIAFVDAEDYRASKEDVGAGEHFLSDLLQLRGEFGRLLLVLADAERCERVTGSRYCWWQTKRHRKRIAQQFKLCLQVLEE